MPSYRYIDVSGQPNAAESARIRPAAQQGLAALQFESIGHYCSHSEHFSFVSEVWFSCERNTFAVLTSTRYGESTAFKTLLDDGSIVSTETQLRGLWGLLAAHGVRKSEASGYFFESSRTRTAAAALVDHERHVARRLAQTGAKRFESGDITTYFGMTLRQRQLADAAFDVQEETAQRTFELSFWVALVAVVVAWYHRERIGTLGAIAATAAGIAFTCAGNWFGHLILGPVAARKRPVERVGLDEILELGKLVPCGKIPVEESQAAVVPDVAELAPDRQRQLEHLDTALFALNAASLPVLVVALALPFGSAGVMFALGIDYTSHGLVVLRNRQPRLTVLREKLVGDLVAREPVTAGAACPLTSPAMAGLQLLSGLALLGFAVYMRHQGTAESLPHWVVALIGAFGVLVGWRAARAARQRHEATREAREREAPQGGAY